MDSSLIYLAHQNQSTLNIINEMLGALNHNVQLNTTSGRELVAACQEKMPELIISSLKLSDGDGIEFLKQCCAIEALPTIIVTERSSLAEVEKALEDHVMAYLVEPVSAEDLRPSIFLVEKRFAEFQELREENQDLKSALEDRKVIERAKGVIMKERQMSEEDAYKLLRRTSTDKRMKMVEIARSIVDSANVLHSSN